ncbi:MAG: YcaO-like family protein [Candidatus Levybacteria bacterium]|nr:YcaO-like family protein [Candidatus Levybacteria bacterium]
MRISLDLLTRLFDSFNSLNILKRLGPEHNIADEPSMFRYNAMFVPTEKLTDGMVFDVYGSGYSFISPQVALLKCLMETIERFSTSTYKKKGITFSTYDGIKGGKLDPMLFDQPKEVRQKEFGWVRGNRLSGETCFIPAQVMYFNYKKHHEIYLTQQISTGAAASFTKDEALVSGIYEIIERDAFLSLYLTKSTPPRVDLTHIRDPKISHMYNQAQRYNLELMLFDITNDLSVPTFLAIAIDRTGIGPFLSLGLKTSFNTIKAITGSIEEAFQSRPWMRHTIREFIGKPREINPAMLHSLPDRGLYWTSPGSFKNLDFLLSIPEVPIKIQKKKINNELTYLKALFKKKNYQVFYKDITYPIFKKIGVHVYKVIIPQLQPLFLQEDRKELRKERLDMTASYFHNPNYTINQIPHPFL